LARNSPPLEGWQPQADGVVWVHQVYGNTNTKTLQALHIIKGGAGCMRPYTFSS